VITVEDENRENPADEWATAAGRIVDPPGRRHRLAFRGDLHPHELHRERCGEGGRRDPAWVDGQATIALQGVLMRTGRHPTMSINQLLLAPYMQDGSPIAQTVWYDEVTVARGRRP
jgi:hypothetical protein